MPMAWDPLLAVAPLGAYLGLVAFWQMGRHPRVVRGSSDVMLLASGLGGLIALGPIGRVVAGMIFPRPDGTAQLAVMSAIALATCPLLRAARTRLILYHVGREAVFQALDTILCRPERGFVPTLDGFENPTAKLAVRVDARSAGCVVVEASGHGAERLIEAIHPRLASRLREIVVPPCRTAPLLATAALAVIAVPWLVRFAESSPAIERLRALLHQL